MSTLLFVHGTGVRKHSYDLAFEVVRRQVGRHLPGLKVEPCLWGEEIGARLLDDGASVPSYDAARIDPHGGEAEARRREEVRWGLLYQDPLYELRSIAAMTADEDAGAGAIQRTTYTAESLRRELSAPRLSAEVTERLLDAGHDVTVLAPRAAARLVHEAIIEDALASPGLRDGQMRRLPVARAYVAAWAIEARAAGHSALSGEMRDRLYTDVVALTLGGAPKGIRDRTIDLLVGLGARIGTELAARKRTALTDATFPAAADILRYQARGDALRDFIRRRIAQVSPADERVLIMAHSLGGIASFELLANEDIPRVEALITVGSQAPFLYELDALATFRHGQHLHDAFPRWLNVFDPNDMLSYLAQPIFPGRATDLEIASRQPFPASHSAYWSNDRLWTGLQAFRG